MEAVRNFLTNYSDNFRVALFMWPLFAVALTLPILAYLYHRDGRLKATGVAATYLAVLYALGIVCFTLYPLPGGDAGPGITYGVPPQWNPFGFVGDIAKDGLRAVFQLAFNVVFFLPLGFICGRLRHSGGLCVRGVAAHRDGAAYGAVRRVSARVSMLRRG